MKKKKLLIYYPPNKRSIGINAVIELLKEEAEVFILTQEHKGLLHEDLIAKMLPNHCFWSEDKEPNTGMRFYIAHARALMKFCKTHEIEVVFSHLQPANLVCILARPFLPSIKFVAFRHHFHYFKKFRVDYITVGKKDLWGEKIVNWFSKQIVVPSTSVMDGMIKYEAVPASKIKLIPYIYNFNEYPLVNQGRVEEIRQKYQAELLLIMCSRFVESKRHRLVIAAFRKLVLINKYNIKLLLLDDGPLKGSIQDEVKELGLEKNVFFIGYSTNVLDYMTASDLLVHPSLAEASNSSVKEMALTGGTAVVCRDVGDFNDYIEDRKNGFMLEPLDNEEGLANILEYAYQNKQQLKLMGQALKLQVTTLFSPNERVLDLYKAVLE